MPKVKLYNQTGAEVGDQELSAGIFGVEINPEIVQQVVVAQQANSRVAIAHAKDRSEVAGGGKKPWRQKGTGRARHGSIRSPLWRGGGATFGPGKNRNFTLKVNKKVKKKALAMTLTDKVAEKQFIALDKLELPEIKTKKLVEVLEGLKLRQKKSTEKPASILVVLDKKDENVSRSARNILRVSTINAGSLNVVDVLKHKYVVASAAAIKKIEEIFAQ